MVVAQEYIRLVRLSLLDLVCTLGFEDRETLVAPNGKIFGGRKYRVIVEGGFEPPPLVPPCTYPSRMPPIASCNRPVLGIEDGKI